MVAVVVRGGSVVMKACTVALLYVITVSNAFLTRNNKELATGGVINQDYPCQVSPWLAS